MDIIYTDGQDERFTTLCGELDAHLNDAVGGEKQRKQYNVYNTLEHIHDVTLLIEDGVPVACGSFKEFEPGTAEIKRVFTRESCRNRGYGKLIMASLESRAREKGYTRLILETGIALKNAMKLYSSIGFHVIANYGQYALMSESVCMEKILQR